MFKFLKQQIKNHGVFVAGSIFALIAVGCAHHHDVRPGVDGIHRIVLKTDNIEQSQQEALAQASHYCESMKKQFAIIEEHTGYVGNMSEQDYRAGKAAAKVASGVGAAATVFGGKNEKTLGGLAAIGGGIGDSVLGKQDQVEMKFKCL